ncbi:autotransporter outer membrane beta-barrel domain-containing protein, partial [Burkholderia pyrrocinia]|uniref:autotransporter outer membrane beta-barrel domain-containing protein n=1 Tax=Burkholderia pyrrocinia TaxID=60550 RepID=UPI0015887D6B
QIGVDLYRHQHEDGRRDHVGVYGAAGHLDGDVEHYTGANAGQNSFSAYSAGAYATHYGASGWYVDGVLQSTWYEDVKAKSSRSLMAAAPVSVGLSTRGLGLASSLEVGYPLPFVGQWIIEPQAQLVYQRIAMDDAADVAASVHYPAAQSLTGRVGARFSTTRELDGGYRSRLLTAAVDANLWHEFKGDNATQISSSAGYIPFYSNVGGTWAELGVGVTAQVTRNASLFAHASYQIGLGGDRHAYTGKAGVRINW